MAAMDEEAVSGLPCSTCRLLDAEGLREEEEEYKATLLIFVLPGVAVLLMGLRWTVVVGLSWRRQRREEMRDLVGLPPLPEAPGSCIPWEGLTKLVLFLASLLLTLVIHSPSMLPSSSSTTTSDLTSSSMAKTSSRLPSSSILLLTSVHASFLLSGLVDLLHSSPNILLPEGIQSFALAAAFLVEAICFNVLAPSLPLLTPTLLILAIVALLELVSALKLLKFLRCFLTLLQGSWLITAGLLLPSPPPLIWATVLFAWLLAGLLLVSLLLLSTLSCGLSLPKLPPHLPLMTTSPSSSPSPT